MITSSRHRLPRPAATGQMAGLLLCLLIILLAGCGKKTRPVPPGTVLPAAITDLRYQLDERGVTLSWSVPSRTVGGERLPYRLEGFELFRAVVPEKDYCAGCPLHFGPPVAIAPPADSDRVVYHETLLRPHHRYIYEVRSKAGWLLTSKPSNRVSLLWETPLQAPTGLTVQAGDRRLDLSWQPPTRLLDGTRIKEPLRFQVYRSSNGRDFSKWGEPVAEPRFSDQRVENGKRYWYRVRALRHYDSTVAASMASAVASAVPRDLTAPPPPLTVAAVAVPKGVKVMWSAVTAPDLAGYRLYRRLASDRQPRLLAELPSGRLGFVDTAPPAGQRGWYYAVRAFDRAGNLGPLSKEALYEPVTAP